MALTKEEFNLALANKVEEFYGDLFRIERTSVTKNNDIKKTCLVMNQKDLKIAAVIYTDDVYREYCKGKSFDDIAKQIIVLVGKQNVKMNIDKLAKSFVDWDYVKDKVFFKLVNYKSNLEYLGDKPFVKQNDLALIFYVYVDEFIEEYKNNNFIEETSDICDLLAEAIKNTPKIFPVSFRSLTDILREMFVDLPDSDCDSDAFDEVLKPEGNEPDMYVLTNKQGINGASTLYYPGCLKKLVRKLKTDKVIILPSSIHEVILIRWEADMEAESINRMITEVNLNNVPEDEILSERAYLYDKQTDKITIL